MATTAAPSASSQRHEIFAQVVEDPQVRASLTPTHPYGCRRPLSSNEYYPCYNMPHVDLVTSPIEAVTPTGIRTAEGERSVDTIILATGFETTRYASVVDYTGRGGVSLNAAWGDGAQAFLGISTAGFPNLFMLYGAPAAPRGSHSSASRVRKS